MSNNTYCRNGTTNTARNNCRPGWNDHVDELHQMAWDKFLVWVNEGKPRHGLIFNDLKSTRARFKYGLRILKQHKNQIIINSLAAKLKQTRPDHFWKEINRLHSSKMPTPNCIDGVTGANDIVELCTDRFQRLLNCIQDENIEELPVDVSYSSDILVTVADIESAIGHLDNNKSCGLDGIYAEHLKLCSRRIIPRWLCAFLLYLFTVSCQTLCFQLYLYP